MKTNKRRHNYPCISAAILIVLLLCNSQRQAWAGTCKPALRIITLSTAITETVSALGFGREIVATDVTSVESGLPRVSRDRQLSAESLLSFSPTLVLAPETDISKEIRFQLKAAGVHVVTFKQKYSPEGAAEFINEVAGSLGVIEKGRELSRQTADKIQKARALAGKTGSRPPKVLFIYARGAGTMTVAGRGSNMDAIITLAGGVNAIKQFTHFKPYSTEMLVKTNPDIVLMFDFGVNSLGGVKAVSSLPGMNSTNAGRSQRFVAVDGPLMVNFATRLPEAIETLHHLLFETTK